MTNRRICFGILHEEQKNSPSILWSKMNIGSQLKQVCTTNVLIEASHGKRYCPSGSTVRLESLEGDKAALEESAILSLGNERSDEISASSSSSLCASSSKRIVNTTIDEILNFTLPTNVSYQQKRSSQSLLTSPTNWAFMPMSSIRKKYKSCENNAEVSEHVPN